MHSLIAFRLSLVVPRQPISSSVIFMKRLKLILFCIVIICNGCAILSKSHHVTVDFFFNPKPLRSRPSGENFPLSRSEADTHPAIKFDSEKPYRLTFGRGSGWHGLDTIALNEEGNITLHRLKKEKREDIIYYYWETATVLPKKELVKQIAILIEDLRLLKMKRAYHADVHDGSQWIFWLVQNGQEKSIYFNNHFPKAIRDFAVEFDGILSTIGIEKVQWSRVPDKQARQHEKAIWNSIKDEPNE